LQIDLNKFIFKFGQAHYQIHRVNTRSIFLGNPSDHTSQKAF